MTTMRLGLGVRAEAPRKALRTARCLVLLVSLGSALLGCADEVAPAPGISAGRDGGGGAGGEGDGSMEGGAAGADGDGSIEEQATGGSSGSSGSSGTSGTNAGSGGVGTGSVDSDGGETDGGDGDAGGESGSSGADASGESPDAVCFGGGEARTSSGTGECASPIAIDMRELDYGDSVFHQTSAALIHGLLPSIGKCGEASERDIVYNVRVPSDADLEVSVDGADDADPTILVQEGPDAECDKKDATECVDDTEAGGCEYLRIRTGTGAYDDNTPQVVISERSASSTRFVVRFRLIDPGGGS